MYLGSFRILKWESGSGITLSTSADTAPDTHLFIPPIDFNYFGLGHSRSFIRDTTGLGTISAYEIPALLSDET